MSALDDIAAERVRQIEEKGYDAEQDDALPPGHLAGLGCEYADPAAGRELPDGQRRSDLVEAGALMAAEIDRLDRAEAHRIGVLQAYLPHGVCWPGRTVQCAVAIREQVIAFQTKHSHLRVFSGLRVGSTGDHRCGYAIDFVPYDYGDYMVILHAYNDAHRLLENGKVAYVEPLEDTWVPGNHHLHCSWKRCP